MKKVCVVGVRPPRGTCTLGTSPARLLTRCAPLCSSSALPIFVTATGVFCRLVRRRSAVTTTSSIAVAGAAAASAGAEEAAAVCTLVPFGGGARQPGALAATTTVIADDNFSKPYLLITLRVPPKHACAEHDHYATLCKRELRYALPNYVNKVRDSAASF